MKKINQNVIRGFIFFAVYPIVLISMEHFVFQEEFNRALIISAIIASIFTWFLILFLEKWRNRKKKQ
ncbi:hypothetical protein DLK05_11790 [Ancylomarina longa]|uniref:Uncharacterized protein n=1 Tax=Ancylomarina longa TaxID=2487017 RepID=A0A434ATK3_9BACT|nr:hypothetical protein DLK05_11790 [Ancylomarina longa]